MSRGYKAGGASLDRNGADNSAWNESFDPEILTNYELGVKSELFDGRARFNAALFLLDWSDLQVETFFFVVPGDATTNVNQTINVQEARATGLEAELAALLTENLAVTAGVGVIDTEILSDDRARLSGNLYVNLKGEPLPRAPELTFSMAADYEFTLDQWDGWARLEWIYKDSQFSTIEDVTYLQTSGATIYSDPETQEDWIAQVPSRTDGFPFRTPEADIFNLRAGVHLNECWEVVAYIENLTDEKYFTGNRRELRFQWFPPAPASPHLGRQGQLQVWSIENPGNEGFQPSTPGREGFQPSTEGKDALVPRFISSCEAALLRYWLRAWPLQRHSRRLPRSHKPATSILR